MSGGQLQSLFRVLASSRLLSTATASTPPVSVIGFHFLIDFLFKVAGTSFPRMASGTISARDTFSTRELGNGDTGLSSW